MRKRLSPVVWTEDMVATAVGMKRAGFTNAAIGKRLSVPAKSVQLRLHRMGVRKTLGGAAHARPLVGRVLDGCTYRLTEGEED